MLATMMFALAGAAGPAFGEVTGAADNLRTGWYPDEPSLTPALVSGGSFKQAFNKALVGQIYAQPLTANGTLLVVTEDNMVYGLEPTTGNVVWSKQVGTPVNATETKIECTDLKPHIGITGTPVIDTEHGIAYFVSSRYVSGSGPGPIAWYMHAVELGSGNEVAGFPVEIHGEAQNLPGVEFEPVQELQRPALLMMNGVVYAGFGSHCDKLPFKGWLAGVSTSGQLTTMWATSAEGASIWQSGGGLISDGPGQILFSTGNGDEKPNEDPPPGPGGRASTPPSGLGQSVVRVEVQSGGILKPTDFFSPFQNLFEDKTDLDLGSSAPLALPSPYFPHLLVQSGKSGYVYLLNRDNLGGMGQGPSGTDNVVQRLEPYGGVWDGSAVWPGDGGYVYIPSVEKGADNLRFFKYGVNKTTGSPELSLAATSPDSPAFGSGSPIVTSNGAASGTGIMWMTWCPSSSCAGAELRAYNAVPAGGLPQLLWNKPIGTAAKFTRPDASNGYVYVGNREGDLIGFSGPAATPPPPLASTGGASSLTQASATLNGTVNPHGGEVSECKLEYGTSRSYTSSAPCTPSPGSGGSPVAVSASVTGLSANTTYYFRIVATNAGGTSYGVDQAFTTPAATPQAEPAIPVILPFHASRIPVPEAKLAGSSLEASSSGVVSVKITCPSEESRCTGTITLRTLKPVTVAYGRGLKKHRRVILTLAVGSFTVAGGRVTTVKLHLTATARTMLAHAHVLRARATIVAHDRAGATHTSQTTVTIRLAKASHSRRGSTRRRG
jgi:PQQ-like domain